MGFGPGDVPVQTFQQQPSAESGKVATKAVLGCSKQQDQGDSFSLCDSAPWLWQSTQKLFRKQKDEELKTAE